MRNSLRPASLDAAFRPTASGGATSGIFRVLEIEHKQQVKLSKHGRDRIRLNSGYLDTLYRYACNLNRPEDRCQRVSTMEQCIECLKSLEVDVKCSETKGLIRHEIDTLNYIIKKSLIGEDRRIDSIRLLAIGKIDRKARIEG